MADVFILSDFGKLGRHNEHLVYTNSKGESQSILPFKTDMIILSGAVTVTAEGFQLLSQNKIPVYFQGRGNNHIRFDYGVGKNVFLRQRQYKLLDSPKALEVSKAIVKGKLFNQVKFLKRQKRNFNYVEIKDVIIKLQNIDKEIDSCISI